MTNVNDLAITSLEVITAFDVVTGDYLFTLDELQNATIGNNEEQNDITGKQGRILATLKRNKAVTISGTNGLVSGGLLELQTGGKFENKVTNVMWTDYLTVTGNTATTSFAAVGTAGNEIDALYVKNADSTLGAVMTQDATASEGKFAYTPASKTLTFADGALEDGTEIVVYYNRKIQANALDNLSDKHGGKCTLYVDAFAEDKCGNIYRVQFFIPKADFNGVFSIEMGDTQVVHAFEARSLSGACGTSGALWTMTVFGSNAEDVA